ncbi:MAG TPA: hypothetical protein VLX92_14310 [Kofleriaceae bacterium]|nr:hypothetical protein [Kofleriaceae bacterium]
MARIVASVVLTMACSSHHAAAPTVDAPAPDATLDAAFSCASCDPATQLCYVLGAGVLPPQPACMTLPTACTSTPTCDCVLANIGGVCPAPFAFAPACVAPAPMGFSFAGVLVTCNEGI